MEQTRIRRLSRSIATSLKGYSIQRVDTAGEEVERLLGADPPMPPEAWQCLKGWYKATVDRAPPPARGTPKRITAERADLYSYVPSPGKNIPISFQPVPVDNSVPTKDKIEEAVKHLRRNRSGGGVGDEGRAPERVACRVQKEKEIGGRERGREYGQRGGGTNKAALGEPHGVGSDGV